MIISHNYNKLFGYYRYMTGVSVVPYEGKISMNAYATGNRFVNPFREVLKNSN